MICWSDYSAEVSLVETVLTCVMMRVLCGADDAAKLDLWTAVVSTNMSLERHCVTAHSQVLTAR